MSRSLISFDWAMKRFLRNKANFEVLEGFLSELLRFQVKIKHITESESNQDNPSLKFNKVDILVEDENKEIIIIELQYNYEVDYFQRMLFGTSRVISDRVQIGETYQKVVKVYSISIVYFDLGQGEDYIYHGKTNFVGLHQHDTLLLSKQQYEKFGKMEAGDIYPEYYIIKVNNFNDMAKDTLDEWVYYLKNNEIKDGFKAQGLKQAKKLLDFDKLSKKDKQAYNAALESRVIAKSVIDSNWEVGYDEGRAEGRAEGKAEGRAEGKAEGKKAKEAEIILKLLSSGMEARQISLMLDIPEMEILQIKKQ